MSVIQINLNFKFELVYGLIKHWSYNTRKNKLEYKIIKKIVNLLNISKFKHSYYVLNAYSYLVVFTKLNFKI